MILGPDHPLTDRRRRARPLAPRLLVRHGLEAELAAAGLLRARRNRAGRGSRAARRLERRRVLPAEDARVTPRRPARAALAPAARCRRSMAIFPSFERTPTSPAAVLIAITDRARAGRDPDRPPRASAHPCRPDRLSRRPHRSRRGRRSPRPCARRTRRSCSIPPRSKLVGHDRAVPHRHRLCRHARARRRSARPAARAARA